MSKDIIFDPQMTSYDMASLESLVEALKPTHSLEIGSWKGLSSSIIARHSKALYCVDTWMGALNEERMRNEAADRSVLDVFCANMNALGIYNVRPLVMSSDEAKVLVKDDHFNFIYIDGDHSYEQVRLDLDWWGKLKVGGIMAGHDYDEGHPGVRKAVDERFEGMFTKMDKSSVWFIQKGGK